MMMVNYFRLIEPYLFGNLSPEEQVAFERQLVRNPALANEFRMRFSLVRVLLANPDYLPFRSSLQAFGKQPSSAKTQFPAWMWQAFVAVAFMSAGLFLGNMLS
jgi:anti-sigma factor RsiW